MLLHGEAPSLLEKEEPKAKGRPVSIFGGEDGLFAAAGRLFGG